MIFMIYTFPKAIDQSMITDDKMQSELPIRKKFIQGVM